MTKKSFLLFIIVVVGAISIFSNITQAQSTNMNDNDTTINSYLEKYIIENHTNSDFEVEVTQHLSNEENNSENDSLRVMKFEILGGEKITFFTGSSPYQTQNMISLFNVSFTSIFVSHNQPKGSYVHEEYNQINTKKETIHKWTLSLKSTDEWLKNE